MKQTLSGRNSIVLWLALVITLVLFVAVGYYFVIWQPGSITRQNAERALAECRTQVNAQRWDEAEQACNHALLQAPDDLNGEALQLLREAEVGWLAYYYTRGQGLLAAGEPVLALPALDSVFNRRPTYERIAELRRQAQVALAATSTATPAATETPVPTSTPSATATARPADQPGATDTPDAAATHAANATAIALAVQATIDAQAAETRQAEAIAATLTALAPTTTPTPTRTPTSVPTRTPTPTPASPLVSTVHAQASDRTGDFGPMQFCGVHDFDALTLICRSYQNAFPANTQRIYAIWTYANLTDGMVIRRDYYHNGQYQWETTNIVGSNERWSLAGKAGAVWIYLDAQEGSAARAFGAPSLPPGEYSVVLFLDGQLDQRASFTILE